MDLRASKEVTLLFISFQHLTFPGSKGNLIIKIAIAVSNCQMVWINVLLTSNDNWTFLVELVSLIWGNWVLHCCTPWFSSVVSFSLTGSLQLGSWVPESGCCSAECDICILLSIGASWFILPFFHTVEQILPVLKGNFS